MARPAVAREYDGDTLVLRIALTIAQRLHLDAQLTVDGEYAFGQLLAQSRRAV